MISKDGTGSSRSCQSYERKRGTVYERRIVIMIDDDLWLALLQAHRTRGAGRLSSSSSSISRTDNRALYAVIRQNSGGSVSVYAAGSHPHAHCTQRSLCDVCAHPAAISQNQKLTTDRQASDVSLTTHTSTTRSDTFHGKASVDKETCFTVFFTLSSVS